MNTKNYAEKIRRRKQRLRQISTELNAPVKKKWKSLIWDIITAAITVAVCFLIFTYKDKLLESWMHSERLMLSSALFALLSIILILWFFPQIYVRSLQNKSLGSTQSEFDREKEKLKLEDDTRKTLAQIIGGAIFLFGLIFTYNTFVLNREAQITERFSKGVELLGNQDIAVRLGGLYALERVATDSLKDNMTIMEIMSSYVREKSQLKNLTLLEEKTPGNLVEKKLANSEKIETDVQAALTIISRRSTKYDPIENPIDLTKANLRGANLSGSGLMVVTLENRIDIERDSSNFIKANFVRANFNGADLTNAALDFADFKRANFSQATVKMAHAASTNLYSANFTAADLTGTVFFHANLKLARFIRAEFTNVKFSYVDLRYADLSEAKNLTYEQVQNTVINDQTILPEYLKSRKPELLDISKNNLENWTGYFFLD